MLTVDTLTALERLPLSTPLARSIAPDATESDGWWPMITSLQAALANPCVDRVDICHHRWLGEAVATELAHGGEEDITVEVIQILQGVPELHHLPPALDRTSSERKTPLWREPITNRRNDPPPVVIRAVREERHAQKCHAANLLTPRCAPGHVIK